MNTIVIYPGRFQPFHLGHQAVYNFLSGRFGAENVHIGTSELTAPIKSPFSYEDKIKMMTKLGVPASHIHRVASPYAATEIINPLPDKDNTAVIFALGAKDADRIKWQKADGSPGYLQPLPPGRAKLKNVNQHGYVIVVPTHNFKVKGKDANSATQIRELYKNGNENDRQQIITDLYGEFDPEIKEIFDRALLPGAQIQQAVKESKNSPKKAQLIERLLAMEHNALNQADILLFPESPADYLDEKKSI